LTLAAPQQWGRCRDRRLSTCRDEAVRDRRFVERIVGRGPLDLEARRLGARLAARPRRFQALEGGPAPGGAGAALCLRRDDLGFHGLRGAAVGLHKSVVGKPPCYVLCQGCPRRSGCRLSVTAGRTNVRTNARRLAARLSGRALFALPPSALGTPCNDDGSYRDPLEPVLRAVPAGAAGRGIGWGWPYILHAGLMLGSRERRRPLVLAP
jgi:hypothetical protein